MSVTTRMQGSRKRPSTVRLIAMVAAVALSTAGWTAIATDGDDGTMIAAEFSDASPLISGVDVKIDGVAVGTVADMAVIPGDDGTKHARVTLSLENSALPVHKDATATVRASSLLGERFLDLDRGSPSAPELRPGTILPTSQTSQATDLDQVLNTFNQPTGQALAELVTALGQGMAGNGENLSAAIKALAPAMDDTGKLASTLRDQNDLLGTLVDKLQPVASALAADNGATLNRLVDATSRLTATTAQRHRQLAETLDQLPQTLRTARRTLGNLAGTAEQTAPTLRELRPTTDNLSAISNELKTFSTSATRALSSAEPVLTHAKKLLDEARPVAAELRKASPHLRDVAADARPIVDALAGNIGDVLDFVRFWALTTNGHDGISHYFRAQLVVDPAMLDAVRPQLPGQQQQPSGDDERKPDALPELPKLPLANGSGGLLAPPTGEGGSVTGLTERQESGAVEYLLGGGR